LQIGVIVDSVHDVLKVVLKTEKLAELVFACRHRKPILNPLKSSNLFTLGITLVF